VACHLVQFLRMNMVETKKVILGCMAHPPSAGDAPSTVGIIAHPCTVTPKVAHHEMVRLKMTGAKMDLHLPGDDPDVLEVVVAASGEADGEQEGAAAVLIEGSMLTVIMEQTETTTKVILDPVNQKTAVLLPQLSHQQILLQQLPKLLLRQFMSL